jgi:arylsulfatase A-like enzyme
MVANDLRLPRVGGDGAELLREQGYRTGFIGKWHLDGGARLPGFVPPGPRRQGFDFWAANECSHAHFSTHYFRDTDQPIPVEEVRSRGVDRRGDRVPARDARPAVLPGRLDGPASRSVRRAREFMKMYDPADDRDAAELGRGHRGGGRKEIAAYAAAVTAVDDQIGRLSAALRELGLEQDTLLLVTSDHGDMLGSHGRRLKRVPWEESIRVPGIVRYPRAVKPGRATDALFSHVDVAPTMLSLAGLPIPPAMQGSDLSAVIRGADAGRSRVLPAVPPLSLRRRAGRVARRADRAHLYARTETAPWLLYDLQPTPYEQRNLADDPRRRRCARSWRRRSRPGWRRRATRGRSTRAIRSTTRAALPLRHLHTIDEYLGGRPPSGARAEGLILRAAGAAATSRRQRREAAHHLPDDGPLAADCGGAPRRAPAQSRRRAPGGRAGAARPSRGPRPWTACRTAS